jgi:hypothetical protein
MVSSSPEESGESGLGRYRREGRAQFVHGLEPILRHHTVEPRSAVERDGRIVVTATVSGDFPNSPLNLEHIFRLQGDQISSLDIR